ncbi:hypothetical protein BDN71DRAFT_543966 [Pleurotus eryngii]|uniref:Uncharacterized protein n=1 Tax=Pleurotus eryngii TaxID=5323 RepID=A0A9P6D9V4_PLEER|nr:hypothetical protein BDN71DRAFT_543966 [Pleurotus eryngii]
MIPLRPFHFLQFITTVFPYLILSWRTVIASDLRPQLGLSRWRLQLYYLVRNPPTERSGLRSRTWRWFEGGAADRPRYCQPNAQGRKLGVVREQRSNYFIFSSSSFSLTYQF